MPITHISIGRRSTDASRRASKNLCLVYPHLIDHFKLVNDYDEPRYMAVNSYDNCKGI